MFNYKIINMTFDGMIDYKGLDIKEFIPFSQNYDFKNGMCILKSNEDFESHADVVKITDEEYESLKTQIITANQIDA